MALLLQDIRAAKLSFQLLQMVVAIVAQLVSNTDDHQLELVKLTDWLGCNSLLLVLIVLGSPSSLVILLLLLNLTGLHIGGRS